MGTIKNNLRQKHQIGKIFGIPILVGATPAALGIVEGLVAISFLFLAIWFLPFYELLRKNKSALKVLFIFLLAVVCVALLELFVIVDTDTSKLLAVGCLAAFSIFFYGQVHGTYLKPIEDESNPYLELSIELGKLFDKSEVLISSFDEVGDHACHTTKIRIEKRDNDFRFRMEKATNDGVKVFSNELSDLEHVAIFLNENTPLKAKDFEKSA